jgi:hypothetical protein
MKTKLVFAMALLSVCILTACSREVYLYPIQGPLALQTPQPIFAAKVTGAFASGKITATLANGEVFAGPWKMILVRDRMKSAASGVKGQFSLAPEWDTVYGQGFYTANVLGTPLFVQAVLTGSQGTVLHVEAYRQEHGSDTNPHSVALPDIRGVAKDSKGNIFKLAL